VRFDVRKFDDAGFAGGPNASQCQASATKGDNLRTIAFRLALAVLALWPGAVQAGSATADQFGDPAALVTEVYDAHAGPRASGELPPLWVDEETRGLYFSAGLLAAFRFAEANASPDEAPALNGDPLYDAQDWDITDLAIGAANVDRRQATVPVSFLNFGEQRDVLIHLVRSTEGWRINDVEYKDGLLLSELLSAGAVEDDENGSETDEPPQ
jgi:hypothetical protein